MVFLATMEMIAQAPTYVKTANAAGTVLRAMMIANPAMETTVVCTLVTDM